MRRAIGVLLLPLACLAVTTLTGISVDPASAAGSQSEGTIAFAGISDVTLVSGGTPVPVVVTNQTTAERRIGVSLDVIEGKPSDIVLVDLPEVLPAAGSVMMNISALTGAGESTGFIAVTDEASGQVIRQVFTVAGPVPAPEVTIRSETAELRPLLAQTETDLTPLPMKDGVCPVAPPSVVLTNGSDDATLASTCTDGNLALPVTGLEPWDTGDYTGTLVVGTTDVSITLTKRAPPGLFLVVVLVGILVALLLRSFAARRSIESARKAVAGINPEPTPPAEWPKGSEAAKWLSSTRPKTSMRLSEPLSDEKLWGRRSRFRWLLAPSTEAEQATQTARIEAEAACEVLELWNAEAQDAFARLRVVTTPDTLNARAISLANGCAEALNEPSEPGDDPVLRSGVDGISALLAEAKAIVALHTVKLRVDALEPRIGMTPPATHIPSPHGALLRRAWASARIEHDALQALLGRTLDARSALDEALLARVRKLAEDVDQLPPPAAPSGGDLSTTQQGDDSDIPIREHEAGRWQLLPGIGEVIAVFSGALRTPGAFLGELAVVLVAVAAILVTAFVTGYVGKAWGTGTDIAITLIGAAGGTVVLTPLISALDRLAGRDEGTAS